ncbi:MAG: sigma-70 family RNA polymerase sigma factor [Anaerolineae bacterium]|nr:sigma-70 family RNA polymerase sigma factor [Anaerolineae bacterium]
MTFQTPADEIELMKRITAHDQTALAELYDQFSARVYGMAYRVLQNQTLAEEATQDTFIKVWQNPHRWDPERGTIASWLLTIARYTAIDRLRKEKRQSPWTAINYEEILDLSGDSGVINQAWYDSKALAELIHELSDEQVEAIELAYFSGMSHTEIAEHLHQPLGTIKSRIRDGIRKLRGLWLRIEK